MNSFQSMKRTLALLLLLGLSHTAVVSSFQTTLGSLQTSSSHQGRNIDLQRRRRLLTSPCRPSATSPPTSAASLNAAGKKEGIYSRPSSAIERGSGFFVPGLEGPKVRLVFGSLLLGLTAINHFIVESDQLIGNTFSESLTIIYAALVLLQGVLQFRKESSFGIQTRTTTNGGITGKKIVQYEQKWTIDVDSSSWKERIEWAASTFLLLTPATHIQLVGPGAVVYSVGLTATESNPTACSAVLDTISKSKSGRVALPSNHPASTELSDSDYNRCILLQTVDSNLCWLIGSDQMLAAFTKQDLQWLGQLAQYSQPDER